MQPLAVFSQASLQVGSETSRIASRTIVTSPGVTGTSTSLNFFSEHGSLPTLQLTASPDSSSEYYQMSLSRLVKAVCSVACCAGVNFFQVARLMP